MTTEENIIPFEENIAPIEKCSSKLIRRETLRNIRWYWVITIIFIVLVIFISVNIMYGGEGGFDSVFLMIFGIYFLLYMIIIGAIVLVVIFLIAYFAKRKQNQKECNENPDQFLEKVKH